MALTAMGIKNAKPKSKPYKLSDGGGLYLLVNPSGSCLWRMDYRFSGKYKTLALGIYPNVSLSEARKARDDAKLLLKAGTDPSALRKENKRLEQRAKNNTFEAVASEWFSTKKDGWKTSYSERLYGRLKHYIFPELGHRAIEAIEPLEVLEILRRVEALGLGETTGRLLKLCSSIFRYAIITEKAKTDPTQSLKGALKPRPRPQHRAALTAQELPIFLKTLNQYSGNTQTRLAILFVLHTFVRTAEARLAEWNEFEGLDGSEPLWRIPAHRMKRYRPYLVPLTPAVVGILRELRKLSGADSRYVFLAPTKTGVISENTMIYGLYRMGYHSRATIHGFRGTASTILNESNRFSKDWIEKQLSHDDDDTVRSAYNAAEWLDDRREMMLWWSDYLEKAASEA